MYQRRICLVHATTNTHETTAGCHPRKVTESEGGFSEAPDIHSLSRGLEPH